MIKMPSGNENLYIFFRISAVCIGVCAFMNATFLVAEIADRFQFSKRLDFENAQNVRGVEILRHRAGLLCKSCQTILWLKQIHVSFKSRQKICFGGSLSTANCYPYIAWPRNLSAISTTMNVACMYAHMPMHTAEIWKKYRDSFYFLKHFYR